MAVYIGREYLLSKKQNFLKLTDNEQKGVFGEVKVGELLSKYLPDDTYLIYQPQIGKYQPDFLVISPRYGFRLIEVKNWSLAPIQSALSNGLLEFARESRNPLSQLRKHIEDLHGYFLSNHPQLTDLYKNIGFMVIQYGFTKSEFIKKFDINAKWLPQQAADYFKFHLFKDQLDKNVDLLLKEASKYHMQTDLKLSDKEVKDIVNKLQISKDAPSDVEQKLFQRTEELGKITSELDERINELDDTISTKLSKIGGSNTRRTLPANKGKNRFVIWALLIFIALFAMFNYNDLFTSNDSANQATTSPTTDIGPEGQTIKGNINAKGEKIYHMPNGQFYDKTIPEEWFFTEDDAQKAGFRESKL